MNILEPLGAVVLLSVQLLDAAVFSSEVWADTNCQVFIIRIVSQFFGKQLPREAEKSALPSSPECHTGRVFSRVLRTWWVPRIFTDS